MESEVRMWVEAWQTAGEWCREYDELPDFDNMNLAVEKLRELGYEVRSEPLPNPPYINAWELEVMKGGKLIVRATTGRHSPC